jgi:NADP-dependent 3-hydroxy acid dehydrogenase YdfG
MNIEQPVTLKAKTVMIAGASSAIGLHVASAYALAGAKALRAAHRKQHRVTRAHADAEIDARTDRLKIYCEEFREGHLSRPEG